MSFKPSPCLTPSENFRLFGQLPQEQLEQLLDQEKRLAQVESVGGHISDAMAQFPAEDFLADILTELRGVKSELRANSKHKGKIANLIEKLDDIAQTTFYAADYGRDELRKALKVVEDKR